MERTPAILQETAIRRRERQRMQQEAHEHFTTAMTMFREMDMRFWSEQADSSCL